MVTHRSHDDPSASIQVIRDTRQYAKPFIGLLHSLGGEIVTEIDENCITIQCRTKVQLQSYLQTLDLLKSFDQDLVYFLKPLVVSEKVASPPLPYCPLPQAPRAIPNYHAKRNSVDYSKSMDPPALLELKMGLRHETTMMLRNIPNKYTPTMLRDYIDRTHKYQYDFFYLRMDFKNKCNVGYAFINFVSPRALASFAERAQDKKWERFNSEKIIATCFADIQGLDALIQKFRNSR
jgi:hypothetical protein